MFFVFVSQPISRRQARMEILVCNLEAERAKRNYGDQFPRNCLPMKKRYAMWPTED